MGIYANDSEESKLTRERPTAEVDYDIETGITLTSQTIQGVQSVHVKKDVGVNYGQT